MHNFLTIILLFIYLGVCASDTFKCPQPFGYFSHPTDPHKFYECTNGEPWLFSCSGNLIFDATINSCGYDPNNQTTTNNTIDSAICKQKDGLFSHPTEPHKFYECTNGVAKEFVCPEKLIFDSTAKACNYDPNQTPTNTNDSSICKQKDGYFSHPTEPHKFYECSNGVAKEFSCPENLIFDTSINACKYDPNQTSTNSNNSAICKQKDGYFIHPTEPHKFYECTNGVAKEFVCPEKLIFDTSINSCKFDPTANTSSTSTDSPICITKNGYFNHPTNPHNFYECNNGVAFMFNCPGDLIFDSTLKNCAFDKNTNTSSSSTDSPICTQKNGHFNHPTDAHKFYECSNGIAKEFSCPENLIFDATINACKYNPNAQINGTANSSICLQSNGYFSHPTDSHKFYECTNGEAKQFDCPANLIFDLALKACNFDKNANTTSNATDSPFCIQRNGYFSHPTDAHKFYECNDGVANEMICAPNLIFNPTIIACTFDSIKNQTSSSNSSICTLSEPHILKHPTDSHKFYECTNGIAVEFSCPENLIFDAKVLACNFDTNSQTTANATQSSICLTDGMFSHPTDRHKFYICSNGVANEFVCADSLIFNSTIKNCSYDTSKAYFEF